MPLLKSPASVPAIGMSSKTILLTYQESRKKVVLPPEKSSDLTYLESTFRKLFHYEKQVNLVISFQRFDPDFGEFVDLEEGEWLHHLDKLNVVVTSTLVTPPTVSLCTAIIIHNIVRSINIIN